MADPVWIEIVKDVGPATIAGITGVVSTLVVSPIQVRQYDVRSVG